MSASILSVKYAFLLVCVGEVAGILLLGHRVGETIATSVANGEVFKEQPAAFMYGMMCALAVASLWLFLATLWNFPVSSTNSIVGAVIGFALVYKGSHAVNWYQTRDIFPWINGIAMILPCWALLPLASGIVASVFFLLLRHLVLRRKNCYGLCYLALPVSVLIVSVVYSVFVLKAGPLAPSGLTDGQLAGIVVAISVSSTIIAFAFNHLYLQNRVAYDVWRRQQNNSTHSFHEILRTPDAKTPDSPATWRSQLEKLKEATLSGVHVYLQDEQELPAVPACDSMYDATMTIQEYKLDWQASLLRTREVFSGTVEHVFKYFGVFSGLCLAFAHGSNDIGNAVGPFTAVYETYHSGEVQTSLSIPMWALAAGAVFMCFGCLACLLMAQYAQVDATPSSLRTTPTRAFCVQIATAIVVSFASTYGMPVSTTLCLLGANLCLAATERMLLVSWPAVRHFVYCWLLVPVLIAFVSSALYAQGVYAPSVPDQSMLVQYQMSLPQVSQYTYLSLNSSLAALNTSTSNPALDSLKATLMQRISQVQAPHGDLSPQGLLHMLLGAIDLTLNATDILGETPCT